MREFFCGWRRKVGCIMLMMALALMGLWFRNFVVADNIGWSFQDEYRLNLTGGELHWSRIRWPDGSYLALWPAGAAPAFWQRVWWTTGRYNPSPDVPYCRYLTKHEFLGAEISVSEQRHGISANAMKQVRVTLWRIPTLLLVAPLSFLSAYLILWKPRKAKPSDQLAISNLNSN